MKNVAWLDLKLGENVDGECSREKYGGERMNAAMFRVSEHRHEIDWFYHVCYGDKAS